MRGSARRGAEGTDIQEGVGVDGYLQRCEGVCEKIREHGASRKGMGTKVLQEEVLKSAPRGTVRCKKNQWARSSQEGIGLQSNYSGRRKNCRFSKLVEIIKSSVIVWIALMAILYTGTSLAYCVL